MMTLFHQLLCCFIDTSTLWQECSPVILSFTIHPLMTLNTSSCETPTRKPLMSFYCSANTILNVLNKPSELVLMKLLYSSCVPILTYGCEVKRHTGREMTGLDVALNDCIRKVFGYNRWESTRELRRSLGYESVTEIFAKRNSRFLNGLFRTGNSVLIRLKSLSIS